MFVLPYNPNKLKPRPSCVYFLDIHLIKKDTSVWMWLQNRYMRILIWYFMNVFSLFSPWKNHIYLLSMIKLAYLSILSVCLYPNLCTMFLMNQLYSLLSMTHLPILIYLFCPLAHPILHMTFHFHLYKITLFYLILINIKRPLSLALPCHLKFLICLCLIHMALTCLSYCSLNHYPWSYQPYLHP